VPLSAQVIPLSPQAIRRLGHRYQQAGLDGALYEKHRPGAAEVLDTNQKQRIIAMACSDPPEAKLVGPCDWWPKKPSNDWCRASEERPFVSCCCTTTSGRGGKKMWLCAGIVQ
jgi:hypothetical protein